MMAVFKSSMKKRMEVGMKRVAMKTIMKFLKNDDNYHLTTTDNIYIIFILIL